MDDDALYARMVANLLASWRVYAEGSEGAAVHALPGAHIAVFPAPPERSIYNNALLAPGLDAEGSAAAVSAMQRVYADAGIDGYAAWARESDTTTTAALVDCGFEFDMSTRAMAMRLDDLTVPRPTLDLGDPTWEEYLRILDVPDGLLRGVRADAFHIRVARLDGKNVATAMAFDHEGDCGIYNVVTVPEARRRGLGTALSALLLRDAKDRGCETASLQSTEMAAGIYAAAGFRDLGRFFEYVKKNQ